MKKKPPDHSLRIMDPGRVMFQNLEQAYHDFHCQMTNVNALPFDPPPPSHPANTSHSSRGVLGEGLLALLDDGLSILPGNCLRVLSSKGLSVLSVKGIPSCQVMFSFLVSLT